VVMRLPLRLHPHTRWIYHVARITQHTYMSAEQSPWHRIISSTTRRCMNHKIISEAPFHVTKTLGYSLIVNQSDPEFTPLSWKCASPAELPPLAIGFTACYSPGLLYYRTHSQSILFAALCCGFCPYRDLDHTCAEPHDPMCGASILGSGFHQNRRKLHIYNMMIMTI
jgi:hypothetical protein